MTFAYLTKSFEMFRNSGRGIVVVSPLIKTKIKCLTYLPVSTLIDKHDAHQLNHLLSYWTCCSFVCLVYASLCRCKNLKMLLKVPKYTIIYRHDVNLLDRIMSRNIACQVGVTHVILLQNRATVNHEANLSFNR